MDRKPSKINHAHIIESILEIRFDTNNEEPHLDLLILFRAKHPEFRFEQSDLPKKVRESHINFINEPEYHLIGKEYRIGIGMRSISFNCIGEYKQWKNFFPFIKENLETISSSKIITKINRIGLRYINFFEGFNEIDKLLNIRVELGIENDDFTPKQNIIRSTFNGEKSSLNVAISNFANMQSRDQTGILFDIDSYKDGNLPNEVNYELFEQIDYIHTIETDVFFNTLKNEFLENLNPEYD